MVCIYCKGKTEIVNSRHLNRSNGTWRRRHCIECNAIVTTVEETDYSKHWVIQDKNNRYKPFLRDKLYVSVYNSLGHRKSPENDATAITTTVLSRLGKSSKDGRIFREDIIRTTTSCLSRFDKAASVQYRAYHKR